MLPPKTAPDLTVEPPELPGEEPAASPAKGKIEKERRGSLVTRAFGFEEDETTLERMLRSEHKPMNYNMADTLGKKLMGEKVGNRLFHSFDSVAVSVLMYGLSLVGILCALLVIGGLLPHQFSVLIVLTFPQVITLASVCNVEMVGELLRNFQVVYLAGNVVILTVCWAMMLGDHRGLALGMLAPSLILAFFCDALPANARNRTSAIFFAGNIMTLAFLVAMHFVLDLENPVWNITEVVKLSPTTLSLSSSANLFVFAIRNVYYIVRYPNCMVLINSRMENVEMTGRQAWAEKALMLNRRADSKRRLIQTSRTPRHSLRGTTKSQTTPGRFSPGQSRAASPEGGLLSAPGSVHGANVWATRMNSKSVNSNTLQLPVRSSVPSTALNSALSSTTVSPKNPQTRTINGHVGSLNVLLATMGGEEERRNFYAQINQPPTQRKGRTRRLANLNRGFHTPDLGNSPVMAIKTRRLDRTSEDDSNIGMTSRPVKSDMTMPSSVKVQGKDVVFKRARNIEASGDVPRMKGSDDCV